MDNNTENKTALEAYTINLTQRAREGKLDPVIGRDDEVRRLMQILARRSKNNPVLIGDPGVGKTAIVEGLAQRIVSGDVPQTLANKAVRVLDLAGMLAGASYRGEFEKRLKQLLTELDNEDGKSILFIDELHTLVGAGAAEGAVDAANILKPALARGTLHAIGATTIQEYRQYIEKDKALERRFQPIFVEEPSLEATISILRGLKEKYEIHHAIRITDDALIAAATLSKRYLPDRYLPDKAIDLVDEAASAIKIEIESMPSSLDHIKRQLTQLEIELAGLKREKQNEVTKRREELESKIIELRAKDHVLKEQWKKQRDILSQLNTYRQQSDQLKVDLEKAQRDVLLEKAAEIKYGKLPEIEKQVQHLEEEWKHISQEDRLLRDEVSDEDIASVISRWTGIPVTRLMKSESERLLHLEDELRKQVIGQDEAVSSVAKAIRRNRVGISEEHKPVGVFLFLGPTGVGKTELAKALAVSLFNDEKLMIRIDLSEYQEPHSIARLIGAPPGYIGYEEGGQLTEAVRRKPYSVILLDEVEKAHSQIYHAFLQIFDDGRLTDGRGRMVDFSNTIIIMTSNIGSDILLEQGVTTSSSSEVIGQLHNKFRPELLNRIDKIILFHPLSKDMLHGIVEKNMQALKTRLEKQGVFISWTKELVEYLLQHGYDVSYGARPMKRAIQEHIVDEVAFSIMEQKIKPGDHVKIGVINGKVQLILPN